MEFLIFVFAVITCIFCVQASTTADDARALISAKEKWNANFSTWTGLDPCHGWEGVTCNDKFRVVSLNLSNQGISGPLPDDIGRLEFLNSLDMSNSKDNPNPWNAITGDLTVIANLKNLQLLNISFNYLDTEFPEPILKLDNLVALKLDNAGIRGQIPEKLTTLTQLQYLYLGNNTLEGPLPDGLHNLINLVELSLWGNELKISVPSELSLLTNLTYLNMHGCDLWGGLPPEFGDLIQMRKLHLYDNWLSGTIPDTWKNLRNLRSLRLEYNYLTRSFPYWVDDLPYLEHLDLEHNLLYGSIENITLSHAKLVNLKCNYFSGTSPVNVTLSDYLRGNCFAFSNPEDKKRCSQDFYTCEDFNKQVSYGNCAACPRDQYLQNVWTCICQPGFQSQDGVGKMVITVVTVCILILFAFVMIKKWWKHEKDYMFTHPSDQEVELFLYRSPAIEDMM